MALTAERRVALELMGAEGVWKEIQESRVLLGKLLGDLYPEILIAEIEEMEEILAEMTGTEPKCPNCQGTSYTQFNGVTVVCDCIGKGA